MARVGGGGKSYLFALNSDLTKVVKCTNFEIDTPDTPVEVTAISDALLSFGGDKKNLLEQTDITPNDDGTVTAKITHLKYDKALSDFLKVACPRKTTSTISGATEIYSEDGSYSVGGAGASASGRSFLLVSYGPTEGIDNTDTTRPVNFIICTVSQTSGGISYKRNEWVKPTLEFKSAAAGSTGLSIPLEIIDTTLCTAPVADVTIAKGFHYTEEWLTKKA